MKLLKKIRTAIVLGMLLGSVQIGLAQKTSNGPQGQGGRRHKETKVAKHPEASEPDGYVNGHGYVDLGLPSGTLWATCNVGASEPHQKGGYYRFGSIRMFPDEDLSWQKPEVGNISGTKYDTAFSQMKMPWCMPSKEDWMELITFSKWTWVGNYNDSGEKVWLVVGPNKKSIIFPMVGSVGSFYSVKDGVVSRIRKVSGDGSEDDGYGAYWSQEMRKLTDQKEWCYHIFMRKYTTPDENAYRGEDGSNSCQIRGIIRKKII